MQQKTINVHNFAILVHTKPTDVENLQSLNTDGCTTEPPQLERRLSMLANVATS